MKVARTVWAGGKSLVDYLSAYKQPLVVNVNIEFTSLVDGVMAFGDTSGEAQIDPYEKNAYSTIDQIIPVNSESQNIDGSVLPTVVPTLGGIIRSFQPVQMSGISFGYGPQQSTRDDVMVGGNGSGGLIGGGIFESIFSPFDEVYAQATSNAITQGTFGNFISGIAETAGSVARGVSVISGAVTKTVGSATNLANLVTNGKFSKTDFGRSVAEFGENIKKNSSAVVKIAGSATALSKAVNQATTTFGSLFKTPVKK